MAWSWYLRFIVVLFIACSLSSILLYKYASSSYAVGSDGIKRKFHHPFIQNVFMFIGMFLNFVAYKILFWYCARREDGSEDSNVFTKGNRDFSIVVLLAPAIADLLAQCTSMMALSLTYLSSYSLLNSAIVVLVGLSSMIFLGRRFVKREVFGIILVIFGITFIAAVDVFAPAKIDEEKKEGDEEVVHSLVNVIMGDCLYLISRCFRTAQFILEEKYVAGLNIPALQAVGWEGIFGLAIQVPLLLPMYFIRTYKPFSLNPSGRMEDVIDACVQMVNNPMIFWCHIGVVIALALNNFTAITITKELSAITRVVLVQLTAIVFYVVGLLGYKEEFRWLQLSGYLCTLFGICLYNDVTCQGVRQKIWVKIKGPPEVVEGDTTTTAATPQPQPPAKAAK